MAQSEEPYRVAPRPRFPALDPEPPPRPWRIVAPALVVALALTGGMTYAALAPSGVHKQSAAISPVSRSTHFNGIVLAETQSGALSLTDLRTGKEDLLKGLGEFGSYPGAPVLSADEKFLIDPGTGKVISLSNVLDPATVANQLNVSPNSTASYPWSDHDEDVLVLASAFTYGFIGNGDATLESVQTGATVDLGAADSAAGDPQQAGAFLAVPASGVSAANSGRRGPDSQLVLADAGASPQVLATSAALTGALSFGTGTAVTLEPVVNPQGTMVAVQVAADNKTQTPSGVVVVSRSGRVLDAAQIARGGSTVMSWSPAGSDLAVVTDTASGLELVQWKIGAKPTSTPFPKGLLLADQCRWSPDGSAVLCSAFTVPHHNQALGSSTESWVVIASGRAHLLAEHGLVLAWLSGRLGR